MAYSQSIQKGQVPVFCNLCESETKINWKCLKCDMLMCTKCKDNKHSRFGKSHKVIDIKEVGKRTEEVVIDNIECRIHQDQTCVMYCKTCDTLVCLACIANVHKGHVFVPITEMQITKLKIQQRIDEMKKKDSMLTDIEKNEKTKFEETKRKIEERKKALKKSVDEYIAELKNELNQKWEVFLKSVQEERKKLTQYIKRMEKQKSEVDEVNKSKDGETIFKRTNSERSLDLKVEPSEMKFDIMPTFLSGEITQYNVGSLQEKVDVKDIRQFKLEFPGVYYLSTCLDHSLWISNNNMLQKVKIDGQRISVISSFNLNIYGMSVTSSGDVLIVPDASTLKTISSKTGELQDSIYSVDPLILTAVHVTEDDKVIVGTKTLGKSRPVTGRRAVIVMNKDGEHEAVYEHDTQGNRIFSYVGLLTTTKNSNIFAVDRLSEDCTGRLVILDQRGDILQIYTGHPDINTKVKPFKPVGLVTTPSDNVIVTELNIYILHILKNTGQPLTHVNMKNVGIIRPFSLAYNTTGQLYIGCNTQTNSTEKAKLYEVKLNI